MKTELQTPTPHPACPHICPPFDPNSFSMGKLWKLSNDTCPENCVLSKGHSSPAKKILFRGEGAAVRISCHSAFTGAGMLLGDLPACAALSTLTWEFLQNGGSRDPNIGIIKPPHIAWLTWSCPFLPSFLTDQLKP